MEFVITKKFISLNNPIEAKKIQILVGVYDFAHFTITEEKEIFFNAPINVHSDELVKKSAIIISYNAENENLHLLAQLISAILKTNYRLTSEISLNGTDRRGGILLDSDVFDIDTVTALQEELKKEENNFSFSDSVVNK